LRNGFAGALLGDPPPSNLQNVSFASSNRPSGDAMTPTITGLRRIDSGKASARIDLVRAGAGISGIDPTLR
jgi:hypothetical protein